MEKLKKKIEDSQLKYFQFRLNEVLSFCESPIEKIMILQLINYFQEVQPKNSIVDFQGIEFLKDYRSIGFKGEERINRYDYRWVFDGYQKFAGFRIDLGEEPRKHLSPQLLTRQIEIYPQFEESVNDKDYRIDIAFILTRKDYETDEIFEIRKLAIECDGFDYHKQPKKFKEDKIRERALKSKGWKDVLRYSGSEIYAIGDNLEKTRYNFIEMMNIIML